MVEQPSCKGQVAGSNPCRWLQKKAITVNDPGSEALGRCDGLAESEFTEEMEDAGMAVMGSRYLGDGAYDLSGDFYRQIYQAMEAARVLPHLQREGRGQHETASCALGADPVRPGEFAAAYSKLGSIFSMPRGIK